MKKTIIAIAMMLGLASCKTLKTTQTIDNAIYYTQKHDYCKAQEFIDQAADEFDMHGKVVVKGKGYRVVFLENK